MDRVTELKAQIRAKLEQVSALAKTAEDASRDFTDDERGQVTSLMKEAQDLKGKLDVAKGDAGVRDQVKALGAEVGADDVDAQVKQAEQSQGTQGLWTPAKGKSLGESFVDSEPFQAMLKTAPNGVFQEKQRVQSNPVSYKALITGGSDTSGGAFVFNDTPYASTPQVTLTAFERPLTLRQLVTGGTTTSDTIEYVRLTGVTNAAAPVAEATSSAPPTTGASSGAPLTLAAGGGYKPESALAAVKVTTPVRTIAHWIPITKRALADAAQVRTLIDAFLRYGLDEELEDQMIGGDGTGENFTGIGNISGTQTQAAVTDPAGGPAGIGALLAVRRAKTLVRTVGRSVANGVVIHPTNLQQMEEIMDLQGRFYGTGPFGDNAVNTLWGLRVVESEAVPANTAWIGDWRKAILWDREQASITMTDSHADFFIRNLVAILAEMRAAFGVLQPNAFVETDVTPTPTP